MVLSAKTLEVEFDRGRIRDDLRRFTSADRKTDAAQLEQCV